MRVGISAYLLHRGASYRAAGVSVYTERLLAELPRVGPDIDFRVFQGRNGSALDLPSVRTVLPTENPVLRILWEQTGLLRQAQDVDVLHGTVNVIPLARRAATVVTIHDLSFLRFPERLSRRRTLYLQAAVRASARRASHVIAISESTRRDVVELLGVPANRVTTVYQGVNDSFRPLDDRSIRDQVFAGRPYIMHVGTLEPRKNLDVLIRAYANLRAGGAPHLLALVGARGWMYQSLFDLVHSLGLANDVRFVDYVHPADLPRWYNSADLFAYPSAYEGFGLPVLEAMACGVPTVTSRGSSLGEVAGMACLTVDPGSVEELQEAMGRVLEDAELACRLRRLGIERASAFSWTRTAHETVDVYRKTYGA